MTSQMTYLHPDHIFDGDVLRKGYVAVKSGSITGILDSLPTGSTAQTLQGTLSPGYLDLQVNGGGDALLNNTPTPQAMQTMAAAHRHFGTVGIMPMPPCKPMACAGFWACTSKARILALPAVAPMPPNSSGLWMRAPCRSCNAFAKGMWR